MIFLYILKVKKSMCNTQICKSIRNEIIFSICVAFTHWYM
jgi:hypothetical protein